jgi:putative flippase GtrA
VTERPSADTGANRLISFANLRTHPAPRYLVSGSLTFLVDIGSLKLLHGVAHMALVPAVVVAFAIAFAFNFTASRQWTFAIAAREGQAHRQLIRYLILVGVNLVITVVLVSGFSAVGVNYLIAKLVAAVINASGNFFAYRHWIFAAPPVL